MASNKIMIKVKGYVKENWGSPFIVGFMLLLMVAAVSLSLSYAAALLPLSGFKALNGTSFAEGVAVYAYYALVAGVVLQLACFLKYRRKSDGDEVAV
jgi:hypothetical protein